MRIISLKTTLEKVFWSSVAVGVAGLVLQFFIPVKIAMIVFLAGGFLAAICTMIRLEEGTHPWKWLVKADNLFKKHHPWVECSIYCAFIIACIILVIQAVVHAYAKP